jgi:hypothetical protein
MWPKIQPVGNINEWRDVCLSEPTSSSSFSTMQHEGGSEAMKGGGGANRRGWVIIIFFCLTEHTCTVFTCIIQIQPLYGIGGLTSLKYILYCKLYRKTKKQGGLIKD